MANKFTAEDLLVLINLSPSDFTKPFIKAYNKTSGTMLDSEVFTEGAVLEFLAADFKDVPKYTNQKFHTLIKWRLMIGK